jgi:ankyrin repeat protein
MQAAANGNAEVVRWLLDNKADAHRLNDQGEKALHLAAAAGCIDVISTLSPLMDDLDELSGSQRSALMLAAHNGNVNAMRTLLELGSKAEKTSPDGWTALHAAVSGSEVEAASLLLDNKADVNALTQGKATPMLLAIMEKNKPMIELLSSRGGKLLHLDTPDEHGRTHLLRAVMDKRWEHVSALVEAGATIYCKDKDGITPLMAAEQLGAPENVKAQLSPDTSNSLWLSAENQRRKRHRAE